MDLLIEVRQRHATTMLIGTHDTLVASRCDRIVRLLDGQVQDEIEVPRGIEPEAMLDRITRVESG